MANSTAILKALVARALAVLTTGEVAGSRMDLSDAWGGDASLQYTFTLGSLTNVALRFYVSMDGVTWVPLEGPTGAALTRTLTASGTGSIPVLAKGWKFLRVSAQGSGTVTGSSLALTYRFLRRASQG